MHCQNALRSGEIFVVLYEASAGGGLYIKANDATELSGSGLETGLAVHNQQRAKLGLEPLPLTYYKDASPQLLYRAQPSEFYVNSAERGQEGHITRDYRHQISRQDLVAC